MTAYDPSSMDPAIFIHDGEILETLEAARTAAQDPARVRAILDKAAGFGGLTHREAAVLLDVQDPQVLEEVFRLARHVKEHIYGRRIVMFAPLYLSDFCVNQCSYCGYNHGNPMPRRRLDQAELAEEVRVLEGLGHKRLALEVGEDPVNCPLDYVLECISTIYSLKFDNGAIRRVNVNVAATTEEDYRRLKDAGIGTYILFQETYHKPTYQTVHRGGPKRNYEWHTTAHDRAMKAGIDDVGLGVLYGLYDWRYDTVAMLMHGEHLEAALGVGPHTLSVPRIRSASGVTASQFPHLVGDDDFKKVVAVLRLAVPYTGMILSTREPMGYREEVIALGISQVSAGSCTGVGGYAQTHKLGEPEPVPQFEPADHRSPTEVLKDLLRDGYIPSYCTACYREGRTGDRFMKLAKSGQIANVCQPNALLTLMEYIEDYGDTELRGLGEAIIAKELATIPNPKARTAAEAYLERIRAGERDLRF
ncbi:[FeFe] hydrogenase H-cluster radical SAM maturase HydG [Mesoterricola sediminis]|uniref:[FeFe] hydrogenase H-cluster radical SAM maturase HydG n=1 Tax=Mesoterricola sediminis TaxID=2927980 RepID=A0AA48GW89_9BACT|nr:[FeFe] hydrogenase H-cluster radical SAM maturase HydG [Mesoterricola sediminis]BDU76810.1 [FeFe] hydrogenase H-cluster radical SAM maturase HydG [Mesoterricola sediminis]